jgi:4'-phosphopantetheinyl transferase
VSAPGSDGVVTLWYTFFDAVADPGLLDRYRELLDAGERQRERGFHFERDRVRHVIAHCLLRAALSREAGGTVAPERWQFTAGRFGKPHLSGADAPALSFNLTHADGLAAVAVVRGGAIGVDAERISGNQAAAADAVGLFAPHEAADVEACPPGDRAARFLEYWTLKEAQVKAVGGGLALPFDRPAFRFPTERSIELCAGEDPGGNGAAWKFWQLRIRDDFLVAICVERTGPRSPRLQLRELVPLVSETPVPWLPLRESA